MNVAFYAPMKPPSHPSPSGDRRMARLLIAALEAAGHAVELASDFRSYDGEGSATRQRALKASGASLARRLVARYGARSAARRPEAWLTYHLYHKAPDWLGPAVSEALRIPYLIAEASFARKQAHGPYAMGHEAAARAIARANAIISFTPEDEEGVAPLVGDKRRLHRLAPFLDPAPFAAAHRARQHHRAALAAALGLDASLPWLLAVGMMRPGDKLASYRLLARAMGLVGDRRYALIIVGDGEARPIIEAEFAGLSACFVGTQPAEAMPAFYAAADLFVWPAVNEAYGMALLEAQASGLPVVAGRERGVPEVVADGLGGVLVEPRRHDVFADAVRALLDDATRRRELGKGALARVAARHSLEAARDSLDRILRDVMPS